MNFFQLLGLGYKNYILGIVFLIKHKLYWFALFPLILFVGVYWLGTYFESLEYSIGHDIAREAKNLNSLNEVTWRSIQMHIFEVLNIIFTKFTLYIVVVILSPLLSFLSERIEKILTGNKYKFSLKQLMHDIRRGMQIALRNILWEYFIIVLMIGLTSIVDNSFKDWLVLAVTIPIGFYFYGFAFMDYINERRRLNIQQSIYFVSKHKGLAVAIGSIYSIFFLSFFYVFRNISKFPTDTGTQLFWGSILVITLLLAAIAPILAITSATLSMHDLVDLSKNEHALREEAIRLADEQEGAKEREEE
jgi:CysZ protein